MAFWCHLMVQYSEVGVLVSSNVAFLNRRAAARYRALASIIPGRERFSWNLSFFMHKYFIVEIF